MTIGAKRNLAIEHARGEVIAHFDSDDWSASNRISTQVRSLVDNAKQITGYNRILFFDHRTNSVYRYEGGPGYAVGASMCYRREYWARRRFEDTSFAEDHQFLVPAQHSHEAIAVDGVEFLVARVHGANTGSSARVGQNGWPQVPASALPKGFFEALR